jgi:hypothetical protein
MNMETISRLARHGVAVAIAYLIGKGYLPADLAGPVTELAVAVVTAVGAAYLGERVATKRRKVR